MSATIYRCETCGKWSHASRKPKFHQRTVADYGSEYQPDAESVIFYLPPSNDPASEDGGGWVVKCGPFATYRAERIES